MSADFIVVVPSDPACVVTPEAQLRVAAILKRLAPAAESITPEVSKAIRFHDCGSNFESISCPRCAAEISIDWWQDAEAKAELEVAAGTPIVVVHQHI